MSHFLTTDFVFAGTTIDPTPVSQYLFNTEFRMLRYAEAMGMNPVVVATLDRMEFIGLQIRHYIAGFQKTLHRTLKEVRLFMHDYSDAAATLIPAVIAVIRNALEKNEWYELLPRFNKAVTVIEHLLVTAPQTL